MATEVEKLNEIITKFNNGEINTDYGIPIKIIRGLGKTLNVTGKGKVTFGDTNGGGNDDSFRITSLIVDGVSFGRINCEHNQRFEFEFAESLEFDATDPNYNYTGDPYWTVILY